MEEGISAADANRKFSPFLRRVRAVAAHEKLAVGTRAALLARLEKQQIVKTRKWTREELYADDR